MDASRLPPSPQGPPHPGPAPQAGRRLQRPARTRRPAAHAAGRAARVLLAMAALAGALTAQPAQASLPDEAEMAAALDDARPLAAALDLALTSGGLWAVALQRRMPLLARLAGRSCEITYTPYTPGEDWRWLFPPLPAAQRQAWLQAAVRHELMHCAEQAPAADTADAPGAGEPAGAAAQGPAPPRPLAAGAQALWRAEALADLAFAAHLQARLPEPQARALIEHLRRERAARGGVDPLHDTAAVLDCHLRQPAPPPEDRQWLQRLQARLRHCLPP
ncbi:MAG: hypothetical protein RL223_1672 [Pseudomonadota bacterium]